VLLALLLAAQTPKPPAQVVVPKSLRERREAEMGEVAPEKLPLFANPKLAAALGTLKPEAGAWAEYLVRTRGEKGMRLRATIVPPLLEGGRYWLELATLNEDGVAGAAKLLVHGNALGPRDFERVFVMLAGQQPIDVPLDQLDVPEKDAPAPPKVEKLGKSKAQVRAGAFEAELLRAGDTRVWRSDSVPLWGLVKAKSPGQSVELIGSGRTGGHTVFPAGWGDERDQGKGSESTK
jgi:hypothetical protein